jgi:cbb3-type cytochrome oxidase subunit 3
MSLSDLMSGSGMTAFAEWGLVLSILAFLAIVAWTFLKRNRAVQDEMSRLPLDDDSAPAGRPSHRTTRHEDRRHV